MITLYFILSKGVAKYIGQSVGIQFFSCFLLYFCPPLTTCTHPDHWPRLHSFKVIKLGATRATHCHKNWRSCPELHSSATVNKGMVSAIFFNFLNGHLSTLSNMSKSELVSISYVKYLLNQKRNLSQLLVNSDLLSHWKYLYFQMRWVPPESWAHWLGRTPSPAVGAPVGAVSHRVLQLDPGRSKNTGDLRKYSLLIFLQL